MAVNNILNFKNYHTITLYTRDYNNSGMKIVPLTSLGFAQQESIKMKILDNAGLDIARSGDDFISDVTLTPDLLKYCTNIAPAQYRQLEVLRNRFYLKEPFRHVDYSSERYWALTSRLRGYHVSFIYNTELDSQPFSVRPINKVQLKTLLAWCSGGDDAYLEEEEEDEWEASDDSAVEAEVEREYSPGRALWQRSPSHDSLLSEHSDGRETASEHSYDYRCSYEKDPLVKAVSPLVRWCSAMLVVEYNEGRDFVSRHDIKQIGKTVVVDLLDSDGACSCTVVTAGGPHASAWDLDLHSDEGAYEAGVNLYSRGGKHQGIILMGEQNSGATYNYAMSIYENIIVPDLAE